MLRSILLLAAVAASVSAQVPFDKTGNSKLNGRYNFRQVLWAVGNDRGDLNTARSIYGVLDFDGNGRYNLTGTFYDAPTQTGPLNLSGGYAISASGFGYIDSPLGGGRVIYVMVSNGIAVGSSTETQLNDLFIAAPQSSTSTAGFSGRYTIAEMNFPAADISLARSSLVTVQPNGGGAIATTTASGFIGPAGETTQTINGATYSFSAGIGTLNWGGTLSTTNLLAGTKTFYITPDGNFLFGGSPQGYDMFVGVRTSAANPPIESVSGLYYHAGVTVDERTLGTERFAEMETFYGAVSYQRGVVQEDLTAVVPVAHKRFLSGFDTLAVDFTYNDQYSPNEDGTFFYFRERRVPSADGNLVISSGFSQFLGLEVAVKAPAFQGSGVYLNPAGIVNAASSAPFTAGVSRGEFITLYGTNLAPSFEANTDFPTALNGVQVLINNQPAPIYYVSPTQISAVVPYSINDILAAVKVVNGGVESNSTTLYVSAATPGVFTKPLPGFGRAAALRQDNSEMTEENRARPGEVIQVFVAGLGDVTPPITAGELSPANPVAGRFGVDIDGVTACVMGTSNPCDYVGLAPQLRGLYQVNVKVPAGARNGAVYLDIYGEGAIHSQAKVWIAGSTAGTASEKTPAQPAEAGTERSRRTSLRKTAPQGFEPKTIPAF